MSFRGVAKVTVQGLGLSIKVLTDTVANGDTVHVARFVGRAVDHINKPSPVGEGTYEDFRGEFAGKNMLTGEEIRSARMCLPTIAEDILVADMASALSAAQDEARMQGMKEDEIANIRQPAVSVGLDVFVEPNLSTKPNASKYKYSVSPVFPPSEDDVLSKLMAGEAPKQVEAPKGKAKK